MQGFRQVLKQVHQHFDGRDVALLPSILLLVGSKFVLSPLQLRIHLGLYPEPLPMPALSQCRPSSHVRKSRHWGLGTVTALRYVSGRRGDRWCIQSVKGLQMGTARPLEAWRG